jgi:hypothetical protein
MAGLSEFDYYDVKHFLWVWALEFLKEGEDVGGVVKESLAYRNQGLEDEDGSNS